MSTGDEAHAWGPPWPPPPEDIDPVLTQRPAGLPASSASAIRRYSVGVAVAISGGWTLIVWGLGGANPTGGVLFWSFLPTVAIMAVLAYRFAPRTVSAASDVCPVLIVGLLTVIANAYVLGCVLAVAIFGPDPAIFVQGFGLAAFGLMIFGLPGLIVALPSAFLWAFLTREKAARHRRTPAYDLPGHAGPAMHADHAGVR